MSDLKTLHAELNAHLDELSRAVRRPAPAPELIAPIRYKLTRASRARYALLERLHPALLAQASASEAAALEALRLDAYRKLARSAEHIGQWSIRAIVDRWADYVVAARAMQHEMRMRNRAEIATVYPLLDRLDTAQAA